ncbi:TPA: hypothetical protein ACTYZB_004856 [Klebsiella variicola]
MSWKVALATGLALFSSLAFCGDKHIQKCQMSIIKFKSGKTTAVSQPITQAMLVADDQQFYAVIGDRVIRSPVLMNRPSEKAGYKAGTVYIMRANSFSVMYDEFGYVFDECGEVN